MMRSMLTQFGLIGSTASRLAGPRFTSPISAARFSSGVTAAPPPSPSAMSVIASGTPDAIAAATLALPVVVRIVKKDIGQCTCGERVTVSRAVIDAPMYCGPVLSICVICHG